MRLCVYYDSAKRGMSAHDFVGRNVEWIVCRGCQKKIERGRLALPPLVKALTGEKP